MAELEVIKHTKKIIISAKSTKKENLVEKIKEILLEIFIIVFAVSLSIWLHNWNESIETKHQEKEFLEGIANDLKTDVAEMQKDQQYYNQVINGLNYFIQIGQNKIKFNKVNIEKYGNILSRQNKFLPHNSRFEALKYSGKLAIVENKELMITLLNYYQEAIPCINLQKDLFNEENKAMLVTLRENSIFNKDSNLEFDKMLKNPNIKYQFIDLKNTITIHKDYPNIISKTEDLINKIEIELKNK